MPEFLDVPAAQKQILIGTSDLYFLRQMRPQVEQTVDRLDFPHPLEIRKDKCEILDVSVVVGTPIVIGRHIFTPFQNVYLVIEFL